MKLNLGLPAPIYQMEKKLHDVALGYDAETLEA
jgi:hypothetical protein